VALINTKPVSPGDKINGVTISAITRSNVLVTCEGFQRILKWQK
jgi:hypothetical protein